MVLICVLAVTVAGSCLLTSGPNTRMEGSRDWHEESPLRAVVGVMNLGYAQTTALGIEIKSLVFGVGAAIALAACGLAFAFRPKTELEVSLYDTTPESGIEAMPRSSRQITPLIAAQFLLAAYVAWSFASMLWSTAPDLAMGGSVLLAIGVVWALCLGRGLGRRSAVTGGAVLLAACAATAVLAIAYYGERNPTRRASYPIGNPLFLAACLLPGILLCVGMSWAAVRSASRRPAMLVIALACVVSAAAMLWTVSLTGSRGGMIALGAGLIALVCLAVPSRMRWVVTGGFALVFAAVLVLLWPSFTAPSATGRDASLRLRHYSWSYALDAIEGARFLGRGQGAFTQIGDSGAVADIADDPQALEAPIAHAHNEWLEVAVDLGVVGLVLVLGSLALTVWAAMASIPTLTQPFERWTLIALLSALVAIVVEECGDVGLRIAGLPTVFYTVWGLVWALSRSATEETTRVCARGSLRWLVGAVALCVSVLAVWASLGDFESARASYDAEEARQHRAFDDAIAFAESTGSRLSPQRRLESLQQLCSTYLYVAREYQSAAFDRLSRADATDPPDMSLLRLASQDRAESERLIDRAREVLEALVRRAPDHFGAGWLEYRMNQIGAAYAYRDGDAELAATKTADAGRALYRELARRPSNPIVALSYVDVAGGRLEFDDAFTIIARPLRHAMITAQYMDFVGGLAGDAGFDERFAPLWNALESSAARDALDDPLAPEKLRLAAFIRLLREDYARAFDTASRAHLLYDAWVPPGTIGAAASLAEMADYRFFADPGQVQASIADAEKSIASLPDSTPGREAANTIRQRMLIYHLAAGDEASARTHLAGLYPQAPATFIDSEIGRQYLLLCRSMIHRMHGGLPADFEGWVTRALALRPRDEYAWQLTGQIAFDKNDLARSTEYLRRALEFGADPSAIYSFVRLALGMHPESVGFQTLERELIEAFGAASPPITTDEQD